ncbi:shikimate kinase [Virgibacillus ainsalahensis]
MKNVSLQEKSIIMIGFMGVGKTTIGKTVSEKLNREFIDIDEEIEKVFNMPTSDIFKTYGEKNFREKEKEMILNNCKQKQKIISVGGGAFLQDEIRNTCLSESVVFFLDLSFEYWKERLHMLIDTRPILQGKTMDEIEQLFYERQPIYSQNHYKVAIDNRSVEEVADYIITLLKME